jgi:hypothetical protein
MASILQAGADLLEGLRCFNYSDNLAVIGVLVPSDLDVTVFMERLAEVFRTHQAGPFQLRFVEVSTVTRPFRFLGYHFQKTQSGARAFVPERVAFLKEMNFERDLLEAETIAKVLKLEHAACSYCAAFALWEGAAAMLVRILQIAAEQRARITRQIAERLRARPVRIRISRPHISAQKFSPANGAPDDTHREPSELGTDRLVREHRANRLRGHSADTPKLERRKTYAKSL